MTTNKTPAAVACEFLLNGQPARIDANPDAMRLTYADGVVDIVTLGERDATGLLSVMAWHGLKQKLVDAAAISRDPATGRAATVETKRDAVRAVWSTLQGGDWFRNRGEGGTGTGGLLYRALVRLYDGRKTPDDVRAFLDGLTDAEQAALRRTSRVAAVIEQIRAEDDKTGARGIDGEDLLARF